jgi:osmotically-inducible protein OsmY
MRGNADRWLSWTLCAAILACAGSSMTARGSQSGQDPRRPDSYDSSAPEKTAPAETGPSKTATADHQLMQKVQNAIKGDGKLSDRDHKIQVTAREGKVTLSGVVASQAERDAVLSKAKELAGQGNVVSRLKIKTASQ